MDIENLREEIALEFCEHNDKPCSFCLMRADQILSKVLPLIEQAKQEGKKEVVDFIEQNISKSTEDNGILITGYIAGYKWQFKLKEWGISEDTDNKT